MIVVVLGLPGSGKSYFAQRLSTLINAGYINSDRLRKELYSKKTYSESEKATVYAIMLKRMGEAILKRENLVLDATFHKMGSREPFVALCRGRDTIFFIEIQADEDTIRERLRQTRSDSDADIGVYRSIKDAWEPLKLPHLTLLSTDKNIESMLKTALQYLKNDSGTDR